MTKPNAVFIQEGYTVFDFDDTLFELSKAYIQNVFMYTSFFKDNASVFQNDNSLTAIQRFYASREVYDLRNHPILPITGDVFNKVTSETNLYEFPFIVPSSFELLNRGKAAREKILILTYSFVDQVKHKESLLNSFFNSSTIIPSQHFSKSNTQHAQLPITSKGTKSVGKSEFINYHNLKVSKIIDDDPKSVIDLITNVKPELLTTLNAVIIVKRNWNAKQMDLIEATLLTTLKEMKIENEISFGCLDPSV
jgi:hypothetical protein